jgi:hypothetical protein
MKAVKRIALVAHDERNQDLWIMTAPSNPTVICRTTDDRTAGQSQKS